jgi:photosynthetic reaction center H subunit
MTSYTIAGNIDLAQIALIAFFGFFFALIFYLHRESYREGHPLEDTITGERRGDTTVFGMPRPKIFRLPFDRGTVSVPRAQEFEPVKIAGRPADPSPGAPYIPTGANPLADNIGPAAYANRMDVPDVDMEGHPRIVPIGNTTMWVSKHDTDPRGLMMRAVDGIEVGPITDIWVDKSDHLVRYMTVETKAGSVLIPMAMCLVKRDHVSTDSINAAQFAGAPRVPAGGTITLLQEEKVMGYFGGGYLYASRERQEPLI